MIPARFFECTDGVRWTLKKQMDTEEEADAAPAVAQYIEKGSMPTDCFIFLATLTPSYQGSCRRESFCLHGNAPALLKRERQ